MPKRATTGAFHAASANSDPSKRRGRRVRTPLASKTAAVCLTVTPGSGMIYAKVMAKAVTGILLQDVGITGIRYRKGLTDSSILKVPGVDSAAGADRLAEYLTELFRGTAVKVSRPVKTTGARLNGLV